MDIAECQYARAAMETMARHGIPAHPVNFSIWHAYHSGGNAAYRRSLDLLLANGGALNEARCEAVFRRHFGAEAGVDFEDRPGEILADFAPDQSTAELAALINDVRRETRRVADKTKALEQWLARTARHLARRQNRTGETLGAAMTDALTGLASRVCLEARLGAEVAGLWRSRGALSLVIADIDRFTELNQRYGRTLGDEALHAFGAVVKDMARDRDLVARYDGNAFAIIRPGAALDQALTLGEDLRRRLESGELVNSETGASYGMLTVSVGVAQYRLGEPIADFIGRVEQALRQAKDQGRNRVSTEARTVARIGEAG